MNFCAYCGDPADTRDHVIPYSYLTSRKRSGCQAGTGNTVLSCRDCNSRLGSSLHPTMQQRCLHVAQALSKKHAKLLRSPDATPEELQELGPNLRASLLASADLKKAVLSRIAIAYARSKAHH